jgi:flagellin-like protein
MKILRSRKALSPVIATIILIAVTVAVSIAVAIWMGALSFTFMSSGEQLTLGNPYGWTSAGIVSIAIANSGGSSVTITGVRVNGATANFVGNWTATPTLAAGSKGYINVTSPFGTTPTYQAQVQYTFTVVTAGNHEFVSVGTYTP